MKRGHFVFFIRRIATKYLSPKYVFKFRFIEFKSINDRIYKILEFLCQIKTNTSIANGLLLCSGCNYLSRQDTCSTDLRMYTILSLLNIEELI